MSKKLPGVEASIKELEEILNKMADQDVSLEEGIALYAKAAGLIKASTESLAKAEVQIQEIDRQLEEMETFDES